MYEMLESTHNMQKIATFAICIGILYLLSCHSITQLPQPQKLSNGTHRFENAQHPTVDLSSPPDIEYVSGTFGHLIEWFIQLTDVEEIGFSITRDGYELTESTATTGFVSINADNLTVGNHIFVISTWMLDLSGGFLRDAVVVTVLPLTSTISDDASLTMLLSIGLFVVMVLAVGAASMKYTLLKLRPPRRRSYDKDKTW